MSLSKDTLVVLTSAPTGLGHLRVMDAIEDGKPSSLTSAVIGLVNFRANKVHALGSRIGLFKNITEFYQTNPIAEKFVASLYINSVKLRNGEIKNEFRKLKSVYSDKKVWVTICTHFSLAHSLSSAKKDLEKELDIKIILCVVVTDDSPQRVWAVGGADLIFTPSEYTKTGLSKFLSDDKVLQLISFPLSPRLSQKLNEREIELAKNQLDPQSSLSTHIEIPISGAAVQLEFIKKLIEGLIGKQYEFTIIGQSSMYTTMFFDKLNRFARVQLSIGQNARETVNYYESTFFQTKRPVIEITKPSEQMFKAILPPFTRGGVILLLTPPVGRQEKDNLNFLLRHGLMPTPIEQTRLEFYLTGSGIIPIQDLASWRSKANKWRALKLPANPVSAAKFIKGLRDSGIFYAMLNYSSEDSRELKPNGVEQIWGKINEFF